MKPVVATRGSFEKSKIKKSKNDLDLFSPSTLTTNMGKRKRPPSPEAGAPAPPKLTEVVRKMALNQGLRPNGGLQLKVELEIFVVHVSMLGHLASLLCNAVLHRVVKGESTTHPFDWRKDSTYIHFFNVAAPSNWPTDINPLTIATWNEEFKAFHDKVHYLKGQAQMITMAAQQYKTNFLNALWMNFNARLNRLIINQIADDNNNHDAALLHTIRARIRNSVVHKPVELNAGHVAFV